MGGKTRVEVMMNALIHENDGGRTENALLGRLWAHRVRFFHRG